MSDEQKCEPLHNNPSRARTGNQTITHVAIRFGGLIYSLPAPNRHHDVIRHIVTTTGAASVDSLGDDQGFLDSAGRYLRRRQALGVAQRAGQLKPGTMGPKLGELYSEDLW
jgi:hypothetical protein